MNSPMPFFRTRSLLLCCGALALLSLEVPAQNLPLEIHQDLTTYNLQSPRGVPLSSTANNPAGSDGRGSTDARQRDAGLTTTVANPGQFQTLVSFGALAVPTNQTRLKTNQSYFQNADALNLPRGKTGATVLVVFKRLQVGAPVLSQRFSHYFGSVIKPPETTEAGASLAGSAEDYWLPEPHSTTGHTNSGYYWSPHARRVYAIQAGPVTVTWKVAIPSRDKPAGYDTNPNNYAVETGNYYRLHRVRYLVSGSTVKPARKIYWTEGVFQQVGKPVVVPAARVGAVNIVYNNNFPERVAAEYLAPGQSQMVTNTTSQIQETRTLWFDHQQSQIFAYNIEGRVFVELLGDARPDGRTREHLGYEIVDVFRQANPANVTIDLGERLTAFHDGRDDSELSPDPIDKGRVPSFYFQHNTQGSGRLELFATRETVNANDLLVRWMEEGLFELLWPSQLVRYKLVWPEEAARYSHYVRPLVGSEAEAKLTAIPLPTENAPAIEYQDPLDRKRAKLTEDFKFFTHLEPQFPVHRTLLRYTSAEHVAFERVFSWLDVNLKTMNFSGTLATNLTAWSTNNQRFTWADELAAPRVLTNTVEVGQRIAAPDREKGSDGSAPFFAGHIRQSEGRSFNPNAYIDPFVKGFDEANQGAIIPVNAIPGSNRLEVWWFRANKANVALNFKVVHWPSVIGRYTLQWPANPPEIILASSAGSGALPSVQQRGKIYYENDRTKVGYNPNEEHALMSAGQAYAVRDDLNITSGDRYSSAPFVLLEYQEVDLRPAMRAFRVLREKPEAGVLFDYIAEAGKVLQAPMPLPLLAPPVEGTGASAVNYNREPSGNSGNLPVNWSDSRDTNGLFKDYKKFTFRDRKQTFWVYRGTHAGAPPLRTGTYNTPTGVFADLTNAPATAVVGEEFNYTIHASRRIESLVVNAAEGTSWPDWLSLAPTNQLTLKGRPLAKDVGSNTVRLVITATDDETRWTNTLPITVRTNGTVVAQSPLQIVSTNKYADANVTYVGRPPYLAASPDSTNSFTMRFYYKTQDGFAWPGETTAPTNGSIVPYLRPKGSSGGYVGEAGSKKTVSRDIVYRPVWPAQPPKMAFGDTLTAAKTGLPAVRGQTSLQILYQQSIATNDITQASNKVSVVLHDATRDKTFRLSKTGLAKLPGGVQTEVNQGKTFFPRLPPHLSPRFYFDPNRSTLGSLVLKGEFIEEALGESYLLLNVLRGSDLQTVKDLCPATPANEKSQWDTAIDALATTVETFQEVPNKPGFFEVASSALVGVTNLAEISHSNTAVDSYALSASGPGSGYVTLVAGNGLSKFTPEGEPVSLHIIRVAGTLHLGELKTILASPFEERVTFQHTVDVAGRYNEYEYDWRVGAPVDGLAPALLLSKDVPTSASAMAGWEPLTNGLSLPRHVLGGTGVRVLGDNYVVVRYRPINDSHPLRNQWSEWTEPQLAEGWIKRVLAGINPFNQRTQDLFNNPVNTDSSILTQAGRRWEGDVPLSLANINNFGLIEIYETVLRRGKMLSIEATPGINYPPANDALLLAAGYLNDLYMMLGNEAWADASNPTIGIGTKDRTYGNIATALFAFKGQVASLLEEELALLRGRDDFLAPGVQVTPVYNRLIWNYTRGIDAGEVIYALNYNIQEKGDEGFNGKIDADDARKFFPQGHGDAYGHYLTALKGYYSLLMDNDFTWVPRTEAVTVLGKPVQVDYLDERKFATAAAAVARAGKQVFDLTWRQDRMRAAPTWNYFFSTRTNTTAKGPNRVRHWGMDHWATRTGQGAYVNWVLGNTILPEVDSDPTHEGIQKIDRSTVPELKELASVMESLQLALDNAEGDNTPLGLPDNSIAFDINPTKIVQAENGTHFEQIYDRAKVALNNAVKAFDDAKDMTRLMRSEQDSVTEYQSTVGSQERAYQHSLIELYGTPYPDDIGPGKTYATGYEGDDYLHFMYVDLPELTFKGLLRPKETKTNRVDVQSLPMDWQQNLSGIVVSNVPSASASYSAAHYVEFVLDPHGFFSKPETWTSKRRSPGKIQQAISNLIKAHGQIERALGDAEGAKGSLDEEIQRFQAKRTVHDRKRDLERDNLIAEQVLKSAEFANTILEAVTDNYKDLATKQVEAIKEGLPKTLIAGLAAGGDLTSAARGLLTSAEGITKGSFETLKFIRLFLVKSLEFSTETAKRWVDFDTIAPLEYDQEQKEALITLANSVNGLQSHFVTINERLRNLDDAQRAYLALTAEGDRIRAERETFRQRAAAVIQGFRTRDAGFRIFRNEKLERYKTLFDLAAGYTFLAANAYDYETGVLQTPRGEDFIQRIFRSRALGVVKDGEPQFAGSNTGDPGLSGVMAEMKADWDALKGRLGFNNPDTYGTTVSLRTEHFRILPEAESDRKWRDELQRGLRDNLLEDESVRLSCMQLASGDGKLPVPGIILSFSTSIAERQNLFGQPLAATDHMFSRSSFATKIFAVGVAFEGYRGMDDPAANGSAIRAAGGSSPTDPSLAFLDPKALAATPYVYLIPVGVDSMRTPALGDKSAIHTWTVADVTIPLPFNIGGAAFSDKPFWQSSEALSEELFGLRKHQAFRAVSNVSVFNGDLVPSQYTNRRLIGRSVWNSQWKLVIPGDSLLNDPKEGLDRFIQTVKDIKLHFVTYSYAGN